MNETTIGDKVRGYQEDKEYDRTPLMWVARAKEAEVVRFLLSELPQEQLRAELDRQDSFGWTALHLACLGKPELEVMQILLDAGAKADAKDNQDETPLIKTVQSADPEAVRLLLQNGIDVKGEDGREALEVAESYGLVRIIALLKQAGAGN